MAFVELRWGGDTKIPAFALLFCDFGCMGKLLDTSSNIRASLLSDEKRDKCAAATLLHKSRAVISTWTWDPATQKGSFRLDKDVAKSWMERRLVGTMLRMDICIRPESCREKLKLVEL
jgi:hypothetical protein